MKRSVFWCLTLLAFAIVPSRSTWAQTEPPRIEFAHYWISKSEGKSLAVIAQAYRARHGKWSEVVSQDYEFMKRDAVMRIAAGFPPSAMWWGAEDVGEISALNVVRQLDAVAIQDHWSDVIFDFALQAGTVNGQLITLPITIHNENWAWFNARLYRRLHLSIPTTWDQFLLQARVFAKAGIVPLSISDQPWNVRLLFTTLMAGAGAQTYARLFTQQDPRVFDDPRVIKVLDVLAQLRRYKPPNGAAKTWDAATRLLAQDKAAMQVMGDWAKAEFDDVGTDERRRHIVCTPVPQAGGLFITAIDMVAFPTVTTDADLAGQRLFMQVATSPDVQLDFARQKGSLSVRKDIPDKSLDECARDGLARLRRPGGRLDSPRTTTTEASRARLQAALFKFWQDRAASVEDLRVALKAAVAKP